MKKPWLVLVPVIAMSGTAVLAFQEPPAGSTTTATLARGGRHARGNAMLTRLTTELNLTDAQKTQIEAILQKQRDQTRAIRKDTSLTVAVQRQRLKDVRTATDASILHVLTPDQQRKWDDSKAQQTASRREGAALRQVSNTVPTLSEDQKARIKAIVDNEEKQAAPIRADTHLEKKQRSARLQALRKAEQAQIRAVLTPDQVRQFDQAREQKAASSQQAAMLRRLAPLNLTADQETKVRTIVADSAHQAFDLQNQANLAETDRRSKTREIRDHAMLQIRQILTADQQQKLDALHPRRGHRKNTTVAATQ